MHRKSIYLLPLGNVDLEYFKKLRIDLKESFGFDVEKADKIEIPDYAYDKEKNKYNGRIILNELAKTNLENCEKILAVTDEDLFTEDLDYIFGQAELSGNLCLISLRRLNPEFYKEKLDKDLFYNRILKEAIHELGHTFSLKHCQNKKCVMHFSDDIKDTDNKESDFCEECGKLYKYMKA
ncbi:MAG: archaemetzincin family Zn-dependent metalloprotease [Parcubacteria group bacterium]|nr:archaemetzincin family Zn-dependent metalloprotease [Parcubacteria group bacterium]